MAKPSTLGSLSLTGLAETVLPFRTVEYIGGLCEKLLGEGIGSPADLLRASKEALETKLSTHAAFNFSEMADAISLRSAAERLGGGPGAADTGRGRRPRPSSARPSERKAQAEGSGARRQRSRSRGDAEQRAKQGKPALWAAVERGDETAVRTLLERGRLPEEEYRGWTPLMKAAEEGHVGIMELLLERSVDLEATNKKGRTALSFAAAPSRGRSIPAAALRMLLERGADAAHKDDDGLTAKARAKREKREEAVAILEEFDKLRDEST